ncbi:MAG: hypothetical protein C5B49_00645 [Bdellovibrio sp.]|nr:MAG: hypothetical protein C5B49_00645 [Bdellovibrio sp.]
MKRINHGLTIGLCFFLAAAAVSASALAEGLTEAADTADGIPDWPEIHYYKAGEPAVPYQVVAVKKKAGVVSTVALGDLTSLCDSKGGQKMVLEMASATRTVYFERATGMLSESKLLPFTDPAMEACKGAKVKRRIVIASSSPANPAPPETLELKVSEELNSTDTPDQYLESGSPFVFRAVSQKEAFEFIRKIAESQGGRIPLRIQETPTSLAEYFDRVRFMKVRYTMKEFLADGICDLIFATRCSGNPLGFQFDRTEPALSVRREEKTPQ